MVPLPARQAYLLTGSPYQSQGQGLSALMSMRLEGKVGERDRTEGPVYGLDPDIDKALQDL